MTPEGIVFVIVLGFVAVCAVLRNVNLLVVVSGMMFAPLLLSWRINRHAIRHIVAQRAPPRRIHAGQTVSIQWKADNSSSVNSFNVSIQDTIRQTVSGSGTVAPLRRWSRDESRGVVVFDRIECGQTRFSSYRVLFSERGLYEAGPAIVSSRFPLPLIKCWFRTTQLAQMYVAPRLGELADNWDQIISRNASGSELRSRIRGPEEDEFFAIRKWRSGDNMRKIHWRSTAKYRYPMVKQFDRLVNQDSAVVLDLFADPARLDECLPYEQTRAVCETILSFAATLLTRWSDTSVGKFKIGIAGEDLAVCSSFNHAEFTRATMQQLAVAQSSPTPKIEQAIAAVSESISRETPCYVFSTRPRPDDLDIDPAMRMRIRWTDCRDRRFEKLFSVSTENVFADREDQPLEKTGIA